MLRAIVRSLSQTSFHSKFSANTDASANANANANANARTSESGNSKSDAPSNKQQRGLGGLGGGHQLPRVNSTRHGPADADAADAATSIPAFAAALIDGPRGSPPTTLDPSSATVTTNTDPVLDSNHSRQPHLDLVPTDPPNPQRSTRSRTASTESSLKLVKPPQENRTVHNHDIDKSPTQQARATTTLFARLPPPPSNRHDRNEPGVVMQRKVWVKRPGASATRVEVDEDDLVDNVRDVILRKYANSLGRSIDSPDITLKICSREQGNKSVITERVLAPDEAVGSTLDTYYPGGQSIEEALIIDVPPSRRTPKASPRPGNHQVPYYVEEYRPADNARDYFGPIPMQSPHLSHVPLPLAQHGTLPVHSMSVLTTGQVPPLPSPGGHSTRRHGRPRVVRTHTSSPTIMHASQLNGIDPKLPMNVVAPTPSLPTPPVQPEHKNSIALPNRTNSPHPNRIRKRKNTNINEVNGDPPLPPKPASAGLIDGRVPPINVLLVEDNVINLKLLEQFMRRLKVRWQSAMNGREAVNMWRQGGFHLVLMDIQLPIMNGLEATKEIRRLESVNGIGLSIYNGSASPSQNKLSNGQLSDADKLVDRNMFKSPVIIVALTASSLQSDRHEALAVGCNDFLTKPVNFGWMERKVTEWGCMQALIDFNGWRKWKAMEEKKDSMDPEKRKQDEKEEKAKAKAALKAMFTRPPPGSKKESSAEANGPVNKKEETASNASSTPKAANGVQNLTADVTGSPNTSTPTRRHKGSRSNGSLSQLPATLEVDEKS